MQSVGRRKDIQRLQFTLMMRHKLNCVATLLETLKIVVATVQHRNRR